MHQIRTEQIEFVIQSGELTHQFVFHLAVHQFIVPTIAVTRLGTFGRGLVLGNVRGGAQFILDAGQSLFAAMRRIIPARWVSRSSGSGWIVKATFHNRRSQLKDSVRCQYDH